MDVHKQGKSEGFDSCDWPSKLALDSNRQSFSLCDFEILWMTSNNNRALLLYHFKLYASFQIHGWIETGVTVRKHSIRVEIGDILSSVTLKFNPSVKSQLSYSPETLNSGKNCGFLVLHDLEIWWMTFKNRGPFYTTLSFVHIWKLWVNSHWSYSLETLNSGQNRLCPVWPWNLTDDLVKQ